MTTIKLITLKPDERVRCDGCDVELASGQKHISGINSCCGGCYRNLCRACVLAAAELIR